VVSFNDINATRKMFDNQTLPVEGYLQETLNISSLFGPTIQGEGPYAGRPSLFIRLAGCNRGDKLSKAGCSFCDADFRLTHSTVNTLDSIVEWVLPRYVKGMVIVITGGEPLLQPNFIPLVKALERNLILKSEGSLIIQIETNGDVFPFLKNKEKDSILSSSYVKWVISPKHNPKEEIKFLDRVEKLTESGKNLSSRFYIKQLIDADNPSYDHVWDSVLKRHSSDTLRTLAYLSPIAVFNRPLKAGEIPSFWDSSLIDIDKTRKNHELAARLVIKHNLILSVQLHQLISLP
jgi:organic radical activating enzyme